MKLKIPVACAMLILSTSTPASTLDKLGWLQGCWHVAGTDQGSVEQWTSAAGGSMLGMSRTVKGGKTQDFEFIQIREDAPGKLVFIAQPSGAPPTSFPLQREDGVMFVFEQKAHDFPQRVIYRKDGDKAMAARIEGMVKGKLESMDFPMKRISCEAASS